MTFEDAYFKQKILNQDSLEPFGFTTTEQGYEFRKTLIADELEARLLIDLEGKLTGQVVDIDLDEPYDIFRSPQATGTYVGQVPPLLPNRGDLYALSFLLHPRFSGV